MFVDLESHRAHVVSFGSGARTFFAIPGWLAPWDVWEPPLERLSARARCLALDPRGSGESPIAPEAITIPAMATDVRAILDALALDRVVLMGESLGGLVALGVALAAPERIEALILVSPMLRPGPGARALVDGARRDWPGTIARFVDLCLTEPDVDHLARRGRRLLARAPAEAAARALEQALDAPPDWPPALVRVPTLVVHGADDRLVPLASVEALVAEIPHAAQVTLPATGHAPTLTRPALLAAAIEGWLESLAT
ncbi:MAG: alpha/beta hydrolase [Myxococcales bacterium]|nr:alpha/beta hydrolase [Myxococcales bacterium]